MEPRFETTDCALFVLWREKKGGGKGRISGKEGTAGGRGGPHTQCYGQPMPRAPSPGKPEPEQARRRDPPISPGSAPLGPPRLREVAVSQKLGGQRKNGPHHPSVV